MGRHSSNSVIEIHNLTKKFGKLVAVDNLSLDVSPGEVLGFLGPNGAGKTTTMRILVGLQKPTSGSATVLGYNSSQRRPEMLSRIGYLPGSLKMYEDLTGHQFLKLISKIRKVDCRNEIDALGSRLEVDLGKKIKDLSKGNRQKVGVISTFMHKPDVLILDEPTSGLDPVMQRVFEQILAEAKARGAGVLLSSHVMSEVEHLSQRVAIIDKGKLILFGNVSELKSKAVHSIEFGFPAPVDSKLFEQLSNVKSVHVSGNRVICQVVGDEKELLRLAVQLGAVSVSTEEPKLDEIFMSSLENGAL